MYSEYVERQYENGILSLECLLRRLAAFARRSLTRRKVREGEERDFDSGIGINLRDAAFFVRHFFAIN